MSKYFEVPKLSLASKEGLKAFRQYFDRMNHTTSIETLQNSITETCDQVVFIEVNFASFTTGCAERLAHNIEFPKS